MDKVSKAVAADIKAPFRELAKTASQLNFISDALGKYVSEVESGLKTLNLGVSSWVTVSKSCSEDGIVVFYEQLGYDKVGKGWCIALRTYRDADWSDDLLDYEVSVFNDGPRPLRIKAINFLPALLQDLNIEAKKLADRVTEVLPRANEVANDIKSLVADAKQNTLQGSKL